MTQISFSDILNNIKSALEAGNYSNEAISNWDANFSNGQLDLNWQGYVETTNSLASFLRSVIGIGNETENLVILTAIDLAFENNSL